MMVRAVLGIVSNVFLTALALAQPVVVTGVVVDDRTGQPLRDVVVTAEGLAAPATTDANGRFQVAIAPGEHTLVASLVGYALTRHTVTVVASGSPDVTIRLPEGAGRYEERVTVAGASAPQSESSPGGASLHGRDLQALRGITLDDPLRALQALPAAASTDDFYSEFAIRGSPPRHVGMVIDGIPSRYLLHSVHGITDGGSIAMINSDAVGSMSLMPGSYTQRWGQQVGGQVGIELREGDREKLRGRVGLSGTSAAALAEGPLAGGSGAWLVSARRSYLDLLLKRIDEENNLAFGFTDVEAKFVFDLTPRHQVQALLIGGTSGFEEADEDLDANDEAHVDGKTWLSGLTWRFTPSARFALTQRVYTTGLTYVNTNPGGATLDDVRSTEWGWRADAGASVARRLMLEFGAEAQRLSGAHRRSRALNDASELTTINDFRKAEHAVAGYVQAVAGSPSKLTVKPGVRVDYWGPVQKTTASPWATADLALGSHTHVLAGGGVYRQFPDFEQIAGVRGGGEGLQPEISRHFDAGIVQRLPLDVTLQFSVYLREERDLLWTPGAEPRRLADGSIQPARGDAPWINGLDGRARGLELVVRRDSPSRLSGWVGYAFGRHRLTDPATGETFWSDYDQRHAISAFGSYRLSNRTTVGAKFRYGSNYPLVGYIGRQTLSPNAPPLFGGVQPLFYGLADSRNTLRLPAYARLDVRADRTFAVAGRRVTVFGELANAFNRDNLRNVPYGITRTGLVVGATDSLLPLLPSAGVLIEF